MDDITSEFNDEIDIKERNVRWNNMFVLGNEVYIQFDIDNDNWYLSDNFNNLISDQSLIEPDENEDIIHKALNLLDRADRESLVSQWNMAVLDQRADIIYECTVSITNQLKSKKSFSIRWRVSKECGSPVVIGIIMDITDLFITENILNETLAKLQLVLEDENLILWNYDPITEKLDFDMAIYNSKFFKEIGFNKNYKLNDILSKMNSNDVARAVKSYKSLLSGEKTADNFTSRFINQNDIYIFVNTSISIRNSGTTKNVNSIIGISKIINSNSSTKHYVKEESNDNENFENNKYFMDDKKTILIAEDIDNNYDLLNIILRKNYKLVRAVNGMEAVRLFSEVNPDIILMDMKMPEMGGLEATRLIRMESDSIPIIAVTAFAFESDKEQALEAGCNDFLSKPIDIPILKSMISRYLSE